MDFPDGTVESCWTILWTMVGGVCECRKTTHGHNYQCAKQLVWENRGRTGQGAWEAHHIDGDPNNDYIANCQIICWDCHSQTF